MNSYLISSTAQCTVTLACSLFFTCLGLYYQMRGCKKNVLVNIWLLISVILGFISFIEGYTLIVTTIAVGTSELTTGITVVWYLFLFASFFQFTAFLNGYCFNLYFAHYHSNHGVIGVNEGVGFLNGNSLDEGVHRVYFTWKRFFGTVLVWLAISLIVCGMVAGIEYAVGAI